MRYSIKPYGNNWLVYDEYTKITVLKCETHAEAVACYKGLAYASRGGDF